MKSAADKLKYEIEKTRKPRKENRHLSQKLIVNPPTNMMRKTRKKEVTEYQNERQNGEYIHHNS